MGVLCASYVNLDRNSGSSGIHSCSLKNNFRWLGSHTHCDKLIIGWGWCVPNSNISIVFMTRGSRSQAAQYLSWVITEDHWVVIRWNKDKNCLTFPSNLRFVKPDEGEIISAFPLNLGFAKLNEGRIMPSYLPVKRSPGRRVKASAFPFCRSGWCSIINKKFCNSVAQRACRRFNFYFVVKF